MPRLLFTLLKSPFEKDDIATMDIIAKDNEKGVLLFEDAVYYATVEKKRQNLLQKKFSIYVIKEELEARGYENFNADGIEVIDYEKAVDIIMEEYDKVISF